VKASIPPEVADLLGEVLLCCPATGSRIMTRADFHQLAELTGGTVYLRGRDWWLIPRRHGRRLVQVTLKED